MRALMIILVLALPLSLRPAAAQDFFQGFEEMVETLADELAPRRRVPSPPPEQAEPETPPQPAPPPDRDVEPEPTPAAEDEAVENETAPLPRPRPEEAAEEIDRPETEPPEDADAVEAEDVSEPVNEPEPEDVPAEPEAPVADEEPAEETEKVAPPEPPRVYQTACPAVLMGWVEAEALPPLADGDCTEQSPLSVTAVLANGRMLPLSSPAILNCGMAAALPRWAETVEGYALSREDSRLAAIDIGTSQFCRPRNNQEGADISEHGFANALDVVGFTLEDGRKVTVEEDWMPASAAEGRLLRFAHGAACSSFTTVLGPEANALHEDHFHLDLGCHGQSCTARICE